jgi:ABC-type multidrug transport system ATPase subunit
MFTIAGRRLSLLMMPQAPQPNVFAFLTYSTADGFTGGIGTSLLYMGAMFTVSCLTLSILELWASLKRYEGLTPQEEIPFDVKGVIVKHLTKYYGIFAAVRDVSFSIQRGETLALLGLNGAGKSTVVSILCGDMDPSSGEAFVGGVNVRDRHRCRGRVGYCPQRDALLPLMTPIEHLLFYGRLRRGADEGPTALPSQVRQLLEDLDLSPFADTPAGELSFGNRRKLSVAIALVGDSTSVVLLDEPTAGMDPVARHKACIAIRAHTKCRAVLLTTHQFDEVDALADRIAVLSHGELRCIGTQHQLQQQLTQSTYLVHVEVGCSEAEEKDAATRNAQKVLSVVACGSEKLLQDSATE